MDIFRLIVGDGPIVAAAIHSGHSLCDDVAELMGLTVAERLREEDPFTDVLADVAPTQIIGGRSRFEVDLNRPRDRSVYTTPEESWGLQVWREPLPAQIAEDSRRAHDLFYATVKGLLRQLVATHERVVVLDIHSYNHRRSGAGGPVADEQENPEVNIGTGSMDRRLWGSIVDGVIDCLGECEINGRRLDVRENVKFQGGYFSQWIHREFPRTVCAPAIEFKKTFMNEWTGDVDHPHLIALRNALRSCIGRLSEQLETVSCH